MDRQGWNPTIAVLALLLMAPLFACSEDESEPTLGSESHWLVYCDAAEACGDGACTCGVCSDGCDADADCGGVPGAEVCVGPRDGCGVGVCAAACETDADCAEAGLSCQDGACVTGGQWVCDGLQRVDESADGVTRVSSSVTVDSTAADCVDVSSAISGGFCSEDGAQVEAIQDPSGAIVHGVCYPGFGVGEQPSEEVFEDDGSGGQLIAQNNAGARVALGEGTLAGPLTLEAERVVLRGEGVGVTVIDGDVVINSNNARLRGLDIDGSVTIGRSSNGAALTDCRITGDLTLESNRVTLINCVVLGDVTFDGNNITATQLDVGGAWNADRDPAHCLSVYAFTDDNSNGLADDAERGDDLCAQE